MGPGGNNYAGLNTPGRGTVRGKAVGLRSGRGYRTPAISSTCANTSGIIVCLLLALGCTHACDCAWAGRFGAGMGRISISYTVNKGVIKFQSTSTLSAPQEKSIGTGTNQQHSN